MFDQMVLLIIFILKKKYILAHLLDIFKENLKVKVLYSQAKSQVNNYLYRLKTG